MEQRSDSSEQFRRLVKRARALVASGIKGRNTLSFVSTDKRLKRYTGFKESEMPQARVLETGLQECKSRDWRKHFCVQLVGKGLEIGPLHRPLDKHPGMDMDYIDRMSVQELRGQYPELAELPLVEPTIIGDAETLSTVSDNVYDFVVGAHVIEHMKNPLGSLEHWLRVLRPGGLLYLIVPDKRAIFDKMRVRSTLEHLILDYRQPSSERDFEHYLEYALYVHDKEGSLALEEAERLLAIDYSIHFHVFIPTDIVRLIKWFAENIQAVEIVEGPSMCPGSDEFHLLIRKI